MRAENEDKITPYFLFLISIAAIAGFLFGWVMSSTLRNRLTKQL